MACILRPGHSAGNSRLGFTHVAQVSDEIKEYFPLPKVLSGLLDMYQQLLGLVFEELQPASGQVWHEHVQLFKVNDAATGDLVGHFYLDLFPREGA